MLKNMTGQICSYLEVQERSARNDNEQAWWWCKCICGNRTEVGGTELRSGRIRSCGCKAAELVAISKGTTNISKDPAYRNWISMKHRHKCGYATLCDRWLHSFLNFLSDMGPKPSSKHTVERRDSTKGYEPDNCYWATIAEQNNNLSHNRYITYDNQVMTISQWAIEKGMQLGTLTTRIDILHWDIEKALTTPVGKANYHPPRSNRKSNIAYKIWIDMKRRCRGKNNHHSQNHGNKGIKVCERWLHSFENFLADMGPRPSLKHSIERRDNNKDYCPENCYWGTATDQSNNTNRNRLITINNRVQTVAQWCRETGQNPCRVYRRLHDGWNEVDAVLTPSLRKSNVQR